MSRSVPLHHRVEGYGPPVLLGPSLGTSLEMWDDLAAALAREFTVVRFDTRGHGRSPVPAAPYQMQDLAADVVALGDRLGLGRFSYVGLSLGGAVGQVLGLEHADRIHSLVLCSTAPVLGAPDMWHDRAATVRAEGLQPLAAATSRRWFTDRFAAEHPERVEPVMAMFRAMPPEGYAGCCEAIAAYDVTGRLGGITAPTLVVAGSEDPTTTPEVAGELADAIPGARLVVLDGAAHILNVARPEAFYEAVRAHLTGGAGPSSTPTR